MTLVLIIAIIALFILYKICVIDFVDKEQEPTWRDEINQKQMGFDEPLKNKP